MEILLILPACGNWQDVGRRKLFGGKTFRFSMLPLLTVAGLTPDNHRITLVDEQIDKIPFDKCFDLVGINTMAATAPRAYEIASRFRSRAIPVVLGGVHATLNPEEAARHCTAVVVGPAYDAWERLLLDIEAGNLDRFYYGNPHGRHPALPAHLLRKSRYLDIHATYATLGCRNRCGFCSVTAFYKGERYRRPLSDIRAELAAVRQKVVLFVDDNLTQDRDYCMELLAAITPLRKKWVTQASLEIADDPELLSAMAKAGCIGIFAGLETFSEEALWRHQKTIRLPGKYKESIRTLHDHGIFVEAGIVFGFDTDTKEVFRTTLKLLDEIGVDAIQPSVLTPLPGTPLYNEMQHRIVDRNLEHYDFKHAVFQPMHMSTDELEEGMRWVVREFYSFKRFLRRARGWVKSAQRLSDVLYPLIVNFAYRGRVRAFGIEGRDPGGIQADSFDDKVEKAA
jgi:radical SAM superfamily enzyme YgiQ (UPF0313 family)